MRRLSPYTSFATAALISVGLFGGIGFLAARAVTSAHISTVVTNLFRACANGAAAFLATIFSLQGGILVFALTLATLFTGSLFRQWWATRQLIRSLIPVARHGVLTIVSSSESLCFSAGLFRPRVYMATAVHATLDTAALEAVLAHEMEHVRRRDPLRNALLRALTTTFFFLPIFRALERRYREEQEVRADAAAVQECGGAHALASALYTLSDHSMTASALAPFARRELLDIRIAFMDGQRYIPVPIAVSKIIVSMSVAILFVFFLIPSSHAEIREPIRCTPQSGSIEVVPAIHNPWIHQ